MFARLWRPLKGTLGSLLAAGLLAMAPALAASPASAEGAPLRILAFGDSLVHGYGLGEGETFPAQLEAALRAEGHEVEVINAGNSGDTSESGRARLEWILTEDPDAAIVVLGANDALRGVDPEVTRRNLDRIVEILNNRGIATLLAGIKAPRNMGSEYVEAFDSLYPELAEDYGVVFHPFFLEEVAGEPALNQDDGIHPNAEGVAVIVENILPDVETLIMRAREGDAAG